MSIMCTLSSAKRRRGPARFKVSVCVCAESEVCAPATHNSIAEQHRASRVDDCLINRIVELTSYEQKVCVQGCAFSHCE